MQILDTKSVNDWPDDVWLGYSPILGGLNVDILTPGEAEEYNSFGNTARKQEFLTARALFRFMLRETGLPEECRIQKKESGKPYVSMGTASGYISLSHSKEAVWCALSENRDIGLDAEPAARRIPARMRDRISGEKEKGIAEGIPSVELWTIKEAAVKKTGSGLRMNLNDLIIVERNTNRTEIKINDDYYIQICSFRQMDHQISLAY